MLSAVSIVCVLPKCTCSGRDFIRMYDTLPTKYEGPNSFHEGVRLTSSIALQTLRVDSEGGNAHIRHTGYEYEKGNSNVCIYTMQWNSIDDLLFHQPGRNA